MIFGNSLSGASSASLVRASSAQSQTCPTLKKYLPLYFVKGVPIMDPKYPHVHI